MNSISALSGAGETSLGQLSPLALSNPQAALQRLQSGSPPDSAMLASPIAQLTVLESTLQALIAVLMRLLQNGEASPEKAASSDQGADAGAVRAASAGGGQKGGGASSAGQASRISADPGPASSAGFVSPLKNYTVTSNYGPRSSPTSGKPDFHDGLDMAQPTGTPIMAAKAGEVVVSQDDSGGYGKWVEIRHADGGRTRYAHMSARGVQKGQKVEAGQEIGKVGSTGNSTGPHLHFEVLKPDGSRVDPKTVLGR